MNDRENNSETRRSRRAGQAALAGLFWLVGLSILAAPFLRDPAVADPEGQDPARTSTLDVPFAESLSTVDPEGALGLEQAVREASARLFEPDSPDFDELGLFERERLGPGAVVYGRFCVGCHGSSGDGSGPAAQHLEPRPRNFRKGVFKYTSTESGAPPLRVDLFSTITRGLSGSSMPDFRLLSEELRWDLVEYVRYLALRGRFEELMVELAADEGELPDTEEVAEIVFDAWRESQLREVFPPISEPPIDAATIARGRELYLDATGANCSACHGDGGRGDGPSARAFLDHWGYPLVPRDLTSGVYRAGSTRAALYGSIATGINGTPMPSFAGSIAPEDIWSMVHFIESLRVAR